MESDCGDCDGCEYAGECDKECRKVKIVLDVLSADGDGRLIDTKKAYAVLGAALASIVASATDNQHEAAHDIMDFANITLSCLPEMRKNNPFTARLKTMQ